MNEINMNCDFNIKDFFQKLNDMHCISRVWEKVLDVLKNLQANVSDQTLALFTIYFSQLDDGNICIPLNEKLLTEKWNKKWEGLLLIEDLSARLEEDSIYFSKIIKIFHPKIKIGVVKMPFRCSRNKKRQKFDINQKSV